MERFPWSRIAGFFLIAILGFIFLRFVTQGPPTEGKTGPLKGPVAVPYSLVKDEVRKDNVEEVTLTETEIVGKFRADVTVTPQGGTASEFKSELPPVADPDLLPLLEKQNVKVSVKRDTGGTFWVFLLNSLPIILLIGIWIWSMRRAQQRPMEPFGNFSQVRARVVEDKVPQFTFADVAGMEAQKRELIEVVDFLKNPEIYEKIGGHVPRGVLLMGPPGTGKTLLAKAVAGEAGVPFFSTSASEFIEMFVGVGAARVRDLFKKARAKAPSIIFVDEIDAVGRSRGTGLGGGHDEREQTLNQLLGEMDGFEGHERVIVIAATNRPDVLDAALLRPGRFDRQVMIDLPNLEDRVAILKVHTRKLPLTEDVDIRLIARASPGMSGADLENLCNEAALFAARDKAEKVSPRHFDLAKDKVLMGIERPGLTDVKERNITAYHESGHTLVAKLIPGMDPVHKVTILPRGPALGVTQLVPEADRHYYPKQYLMGMLAVKMGGRAAEMLVFEDTSTGAQSDLKSSTELAEKMVCQWGMSERVGPVTFSRGEEHVFLGKKLAQEKTWSEQMGWIIDQEVEAIVRGAEKHALDLLTSHREKLDSLSKTLLSREELTGEEVDAVLRGETLPEKAPPPAPPSPAAPSPAPPSPTPA